MKEKNSDESQKNHKKESEKKKEVNENKSKTAENDDRIEPNDTINQSNQILTILTQETDDSKHLSSLILSAGTATSLKSSRIGQDQSNHVQSLLLESSQLAADLRTSSIPASLKLAIKHRTFSGPGLPLPEEIDEFYQRPKNTPYPFFKQHKKLKNPNTSIALYFQYTWFCMIICLTFILLQLKLTFDMRYYRCKYARVNALESACSLFNLNNFIINPISAVEYIPAPKTYEDLILLQGFLNTTEFYVMVNLILIFVVSSLPFFFLYFHFKLLNKLKSNEKGFQIADYTFMVTHQGKERTLNGVDFQEYFETLLKKVGFEKKVRVLGYLSTDSEYTVKDLRLRIKELYEEKEDFRRTVTSEDFTEQETKKVNCLGKKIEKKLEKLKSKLLLVEKRMKNRRASSTKINQQNNRVGFVLVSSKIERKSILKAHLEISKPGSRLRTLFSKKRSPSDFEIKWAPEPETIVWKNIGQSPLKRRVAYLLILGASIIFILIICLINEFIIEATYSLFNGNTDTKHRPKVTTFLRFVFLALIEIIFWFSKRVVYNLTCFSLYPSKDISSRNRALWLGIIRTVAFAQFSELESISVQNLNRFTRILLKQMALLLVIRVLRLRHISKTAKILYYSWKARYSKIIKTQKELNRIFEKPKCEIEIMYSINIYVLLLLFIALRDSLVGCLASFIYLFVDMQVSKVLFYRFYAEPSKQKENLSEKLLVSSGFLLKIWYIYCYSNAKNLRFFLSFGTNFLTINPTLPQLLSVYQWIVIVMLFFPFGFLLRLQADCLKTRRVIGIDVKVKRKYSQKKKNKPKQDFEGNLIEEIADKRDLEGSEVAEDTLLEAFRTAYGFLDDSKETRFFEDKEVLEGELSSSERLSSVNLMKPLKNTNTN